METQELEFGTQGHILVTVIVPNVALVPLPRRNVVPRAFRALDSLECSTHHKLWIKSLVLHDGIKSLA